MNDANNGSQYYLLRIYYVSGCIYKHLQLSHQPQVVSAITLTLHMGKIKIQVG